MPLSRPRPWRWRCGLWLAAALLAAPLGACDGPAAPVAAPGAGEALPGAGTPAASAAAGLAAEDRAAAAAAAEAAADEAAAAEAAAAEAAAAAAAAADCEGEVEQVCAFRRPHSVDRCGVRSPIGPACAHDEVCVSDEAGARCVSDCDGPSSEPACRRGDVWARGRCGREDALVERCPAEGPCAIVDGRAACDCSSEGIVTTCGGPEGGHMLQLDSCGRHTVVDRCGGPGSCIDGAGGARCSCTPLAGLSCGSVSTYLDGAAAGDAPLVGAFDTCGRLLSVVEVCPIGALCDASAPEGERCTCAPDASQTCVGDAIFSVDSCGSLGALVEACTGGERCTETGGVATCACQTTPRERLTCVGSNVHAADSCGVASRSSARTCVSAPCVQIGVAADCGGVLVDVTPATPSASEGPDDVLIPGASLLYPGAVIFDLVFARRDGGPWLEGICTVQVDGRDPSDPIVYRRINSTGIFRVIPYESQAEYEAAPCGARRSFFVTCEDDAGGQRTASSPVVLEKVCP